MLFACLLATASALPISTVNGASNGCAVRGFDLSVFQGGVSQSAYDCLHKSGFQFGIIQAQESNGNFNPYAINDYKRVSNEKEVVA